MERWLPITGYEKFYEVSNLGRVRSFDRMVEHPRGPRFRKGQIRKLQTNWAGYLTLSLSNGDKTFVSVHRLVAKHFLPRPSSEFVEINHKDFDKKNNVVTNLEWVTHKENAEHAVLGGRYSAFTNKNRSNKLTLVKVSTIRHFYYVGINQAQIALLFGVNINTISRIILNISWKPI